MATVNRLPAGVASGSLLGGCRAAMTRRLITSAWRSVRRRPEPEVAVAPETRLLSEADRRIVDAAMPYSMTGERRLTALVDAVRYCVRRGVPGPFAECGVWLGGSVLAMIL